MFAVQAVPLQRVREESSTSVPLPDIDLDETKIRVPVSAMAANDLMCFVAVSGPMGAVAGGPMGGLVGGPADAMVVGLSADTGALCCVYTLPADLQIRQLCCLDSAVFAIAARVRDKGNSVQ